MFWCKINALDSRNYGWGESLARRSGTNYITPWCPADKVGGTPTAIYRRGVTQLDHRVQRSVECVYVVDLGLRGGCQLAWCCPCFVPCRAHGVGTTCGALDSWYRPFAAEDAQGGPWQSAGAISGIWIGVFAAKFG